MQTRKIVIVISILIVLIIILGALTLLPLLIPQSNEWAMTATEIDKLHSLGFNGAGVTIGIIDTGVETSHPEFDSSSFFSWQDDINKGQEYYDDDDHGTHLAGLLVAKGSYDALFSGVNLQGIAANCHVIVVKAIPKNQYLYGGGNDSGIASGIAFCLEKGADILLLSMGRSPEYVDYDTNNQTIQMIIQAVQQGVFVVVPAGNDGQSDDGDVVFPAVLENVISVGSVSKGNAISAFSSKGHQYPTTEHPNKKPELVAPGEAILSTRTGSAYGEMSGTAQAATYVTGILALLLQAYPGYQHDGALNQNETTIEFFKDVLMSTAKKIGNLEGASDEYPHDDFYGYGLIQAYEAYKELGKY